MHRQLTVSGVITDNYAIFRYTGVREPLTITRLETELLPKAMPYQRSCCCPDRWLRCWHERRQVITDGHAAITFGNRVITHSLAPIPEALASLNAKPLSLVRHS